MKRKKGNRVKSKLLRTNWKLGLVEGGYEAVFADDKWVFHVVKNPYEDRWYGDPFILDLDEKNVYVLAEEYRFDHPKGRIAKVTIDRGKWEIIDAKIILELDTHLSFPNILRHDGKVYIYPENCRSGRMSIYEYDPLNERLMRVQTICDHPLWDSTITDAFCGRKLFGGMQNACCIDIFDWDKETKRFIYTQSSEYDTKEYQLAGQMFEYKGEIFLPTQDGVESYGKGVILRKVIEKNGKFDFVEVKRLKSPSRRWNQGMHTLNEYKGMIIVDLKGYDNIVFNMFYTLYRPFRRYLKKIKK